MDMRFGKFTWFMIGFCLAVLLFAMGGRALSQTMGGPDGLLCIPSEDGNCKQSGEIIWEVAKIAKQKSRNPVYLARPNSHLLLRQIDGAIPCLQVMYMGDRWLDQKVEHYEFQRLLNLAVLLAKDGKIGGSFEIDMVDRAEGIHKIIEYRWRDHHIYWTNENWSEQDLF